MEELYNSTRSQPKRKLVITIIYTVIIVFIGMFFFQTLKRAVIPDLDLQVSQMITDIFATIVAVLVVYVVYKKQNQFVNQLAAENEKRKITEENLNRLNSIYSVLSEINQSIVRINDKRKLFDQICKIIVNIGKFKMAWIGEVDYETGVVLPISYFGVVDDYLDAIHISIKENRFKEGPTGKAILKGNYFVCNDIKNDKRMEPWKDKALKLNYKSSAAFPIFFENKVTGSLNIYSQELNFFNEDEIKLFNEICIDISFALESINTENKKQQALTELRRASLYARGLIESSLDPLVTISHEGKITDVNEATVSVTGVKREQLIGSNFSDYFTEPDKANEGYKKVLKEGFVRDYNLTIKNTSGQNIDVLYNAAVYKNEEGEIQGVFAAARDITERKKAEEAVKAERKRMNDLMEMLPAYLILLNEDYHVTYANKYFEERFGKSNGRKCYEYLFGLDEPCEQCETYKVFNTNSSQHWEWIGPDNRVYDINDFPFTDNDGSRLILEMGIDITERKKAEEAVKLANAYNRNLLEVNLDPLVTISADGKITDVNKAVELITGVTREELIGSNFSNYFTEPDRANEGYQTVFRDGFVQDFALELKHRDGHKTPVIYNASIYKDEKGNVAGVFAAARNITALKQAEEEIKKLNDELELKILHRTSQLETAVRELEAFSYSVSHDLRAPLRALDGFAKILLEDYSSKLDDEGKRLLNIIIINSKKMGMLIDDLLSFSRLNQQVVNKSKIDMEIMARSIFSELVQEGEKGNIEFYVQNIPDALGDSSMMRQVWRNLIGNALKFSSQKEHQIIEIGSCPGENENIYFIKDNGVGFDMQYVHKLFGVFQRLHKATEFEGTGVGLAIVQRIIHRHGGRVWAEGKINEGATFFFALPNKRS